LVLALFGCGGGGDGEDTYETELRYDGSIEPAIVTTTNALPYVKEFFGGYDTVEESLDTTPKSISSISGNIIALSQASNDLSAILPNTQQNLDLVSDCNVSGSLNIRGSVNSDSTGEFTLAYEQCDNGDFLFDGIIYLTLISYDGINGMITEASLSFDFLHAKGDFGDISSQGSIQMLRDIDEISEVTKSNIVFHDNLTQQYSKVENLVIKLLSDSFTSPSMVQASFNGKLYNQDEGYVFVTTESPLLYNNPATQYPYAGGPLVMTDINYCKLWVRPLSELELLIEVDFDGDGLYDASVATDWLVMDDEFIDRNTVPVADAGDDLSSAVGDIAELDGTNSQDADGDLLSYNWSIIEMPDGSNSASLTDSTLAVAHFTADIPGTYTISLLVNDGIDSSAPSTVLVNAYDLQALDFQVIDAEYSQRHDSIVMVSDTPPALHIHNVQTNTTQTLPLPFTPTSVSVSPYGWRAAVGHDGNITIVDLVTPALLDDLTVNTDVFDVVMSEYGYVYAFPENEEPAYIHAIEIATGIETLHTGQSINAGTKAKLSHNDRVIYGANNLDIEKYSIEDGTPVYLYDSPYTDEFAICGDLWLAEYGKTIFTKCGHVFRASIIKDLDMTYRGTLETANSMLLHADHSAEADRVAVLLEADASTIENPLADTQVHIFDSSYLTPHNIIQIPQQESNGLSYPLHGRYVFYTESGQHVVLIVQGDPVAGLSDDFFVVRF
ncbi:MAG: PKD domain-containing protein, partial [Chromatiales bacterium]